MSESYQPGASRVNTGAPRKPAHGTPAAAPSTLTPADRGPKMTATLEPFFSEPYNAIVDRNFDRYLIRRWLADLGPTGFLIVKILRDRCYKNDRTGELRDTCTMDMDELARLVGVGRTKLYALFAENKALKLFVRRIEQYRMVDNIPRRQNNCFKVSMDDPIHWDDLPLYDDLLAKMETERHLPPTTRVWLPEEGQAPPAGETGTSPRRESAGRTHGAGRESAERTHVAGRESAGRIHGGHEGENPSQRVSAQRTHGDPYESAQRTADTEYLSSGERTADTPYLGSGGRTAIGESLLSDLPVSPTPAAGAPHISPQGDSGRGFAPDPDADADPLQHAWEVIQPLLQGAVTIPAYQMHIKLLRPEQMIVPPDLDAPDARIEVGLRCPSNFSREFVEKRCAAQIEEALGEALGFPVSLRLFVLPKPGGSPGGDRHGRA